MAITRVDRVAQTAQGQAIAGALLYVLTQPADVDELTPLATVYSDISGTPGANPVVSDGLGQFAFYLDNGQLYTFVVQAPQILQQVYPDQNLAGGAGTGSTPFGVVPTGAVNGTNVRFTLPFTPSLLTLWVNFPLVPNVGYTTAVVDGVFTITMAAPPQVGDSVYANGIL